MKLAEITSNATSVSSTKQLRSSRMALNCQPCFVRVRKCATNSVYQTIKQSSLTCHRFTKEKIKKRSSKHGRTSGRANRRYCYWSVRGQRSIVIACLSIHVGERKSVSWGNAQTYLTFCEQQTYFYIHQLIQKVFPTH